MCKTIRVLPKELRQPINRTSFGHKSKPIVQIERYSGF